MGIPGKSILVRFVPGQIMHVSDYAEQAAIISMVVLYIFNEYRKIRSDRKKKRYVGLDKNLYIDSQIYPILWDLLIKYRAIRVFIVQFHNGSSFYTGQSIQRMTVSHEVTVDRSIIDIRKTHDNVQISEMDHRILVDVKSQEYYFIDDISILRGGPEHNEVIADWMEVYGTKAMYVYRLIDKKTKETVATLNLHFNFLDPLDESHAKQIKEMKKRLEAIFDML